MHVKRFLHTCGLSLTLFVALCFFVLFAWRGGLFSFNNPDNETYPIRGLDVSHHQGPIDWDRVSSRDYSFVFIKATEGANHVDSRFLENWRGSRKTGIRRGAYHFYSLRKTGAEQAANFIRVVPVEPGMLPPVIDLEFAGNSAHRPTRHELARELSVFVEMIRAHYGKEPFFYTTNNFLKAYGSPAWKQRLWIRDVLSEPGSLAEGWLFWQYGDRAEVEGITGFVDVNIFRGKPDELHSLTVTSGDGEFVKPLIPSLSPDTKNPCS